MGVNRRLLLRSGLGAAALLAGGGAAWILSLPPAPAAGAAPAIPQDEVEATLAALKPPKRPRPLIAVIGINESTEVTDYVMPYGVLRRADVADVLALATRSGPMTLYPALKVQPDATLSEFDARHPEGADFVIVPAMSRNDDPLVLQWMRGQAAKGATIFGICAGAMVVGAAGLLEGKRATTHWWFVDTLRKKHGAIYVPDRRLVTDRGVATTTGITASMPATLTLIAAIAGQEKAEAVAHEIGLTRWDARHDSSAFGFTRPFALAAIRNVIAMVSYEHLGLPLAPGVDEVSLAIAADAWSRTWRSRAITFATKPDAVPSRNGLALVPEQVTASWPAERLLPAAGERKPADALDEALHALAARYGRHTAEFVAMQLEYPWPEARALLR